MPNLYSWLNDFFKESMQALIISKTVSQVQAILAARQSKWGPVSLSVFSGLKKTGRDPVLARISLWLGLTTAIPEDQKKPADQLPDKRPIEEAPAQGGEAGDETDRKSTRLNSSHPSRSRMPSSA